MIPNEKDLLNNLGKIAYTLDKAYLSRLSTDFSVLCFDEKYNQKGVIDYANNIRAIRVERCFSAKKSLINNLYGVIWVK